MADGRGEMMEQYMQKKEQQKKEKRAEDFKTEREKELGDQLAALEKKMGLKDGRHEVRGGRIMKEATKHAHFSGTIAELAELEVAYHRAPAMKCAVLTIECAAGGVPQAEGRDKERAGQGG